MERRKNDLYRWERVSKPSRVYSRSQKVTTGDDIQDWIKKVEDASNRAAAKTFGLPEPGRGHDRAMARVEDARIHDAAYSEAQDLLQQWVSEKLDFDSEEMDFDDKLWAVERRKAAEVKKQWNDLMVENDPDYDPELEVLNSNRSAKQDTSLYSDLEEDTDSAVDNIMSSMLRKDVVSDRVLNDLGLEEKAKQVNPSVKMAVRHEQVKANRMRREKAKQQKLKEAQTRKEAQMKARQMIQKEERDKEIREKREEAAIQSQMALIRKEMLEERRRQEEEKQREKTKELLKEKAAQEEAERQRELEAEARRQINREDSDRQRKIQLRLQQMEARNTREKLKLQHKYFTAWYDVVADKRLELGKARAMAEWKLLLKTWTAWKNYIFSQRLNVETQRHQEEMKELQRKHIQAARHHRTSLLRRCLAAWLLFVGLERQQKEVALEQSATRNKMAAFLQAAASGSLWSKGQEEGTGHTARPGQSGKDSARDMVDDMFKQPPKDQKRPDSARTAASSASSARPRSSRNQPPHKPSQAWQLTRKDAQLTPKELETYTQSKNGSEVSSPTDRSDSSRSLSTASSSKPWEKKAYVVNSTEHRTVAQQKILEQQQHQIKEQQRLIEELTYLQKQQMLQTQLTQQQMLQQQLVAKQTGVKDTETCPLPPSKKHTEPDSALHKHMVALQQALVQNGDGENNLVKAKTRTESAPGVETDRTNLTNGTSKSGTSTRTSSSGASRHNTFIKSMEERAKERARLKQEREEKKRKAEDEKLARLQAEEEERLRQEEEERRRKAEIYREKKRQESKRELERQQQQEKARQQLVSAELHHQRALIKYQGWNPWRRLVAIARNRTRVADDHYKTTLRRRSLLEWCRVVQEELDHNRGLADQMFKYILIRRCFHNWSRVGQCVAILEEKSDRFYMSRLRARVFTAWRDHTEGNKIARWHMERQAGVHNILRIKKAAFKALRRYPQERKDEKDRERRRAEMRRKVASMLSDYEAPSVRISTESNVSEFFSQ